MNNSSVFDRGGINATADSDLGILAKQSVFAQLASNLIFTKLKGLNLPKLHNSSVSSNRLVIKIPNPNEKLLTVLYDSNRDRRTFGSSSKIPVHYVTYQSRR